MPRTKLNAKGYDGSNKPKIEMREVIIKEVSTKYYCRLNKKSKSIERDDDD